ncbi:DUF3043 domain-containing protein [Streptomyces sp. 3MP-14]|uniref:DUF3043 domain-containing protein n=1 Tax=Streptomyces mimosae TaxID=2586635 RepID=A0A5N6ALX8_9ACTN|nr:MULTISPECIES: DUF3043 domain-containing protein [Streptomyces]KAB8168608.1 DUF3043 domain-containing protein [Streptomyces mimosae]KAB8178112.1 DUF3043 domain-containing protein [Streptomyces sp. 3MP-14]
MFRSRAKEDAKTESANEAAETRPERDPQAPKGRPTPKRSEAEALRKAVAKPATSRKEAAQRAKKARRAALDKQRQALLTGDEKHLPARDRGPVRRYARDFVDSGWHIAEFFLPIAVLILVMSMIPATMGFALMLWMAVIVGIVLDSVLLTRRLKKRLRERYPDENLRGSSAYALMRTLQMRRMRLPKPQIKRGEEPR